MIKNLFFLVLCFSPFMVFATVTPVEPAEALKGVQGAATAAGNFIDDFWSFFDEDVPNFLERSLAYILEKIVLFKITAQIEAMKLAWSVAKTVLESFEIGSKIAAAATALPRDVQAAIVDMRLFDGLNIIIQAFIARYVMRFI